MAIATNHAASADSKVVPTLRPRVSEDS